MILKIKRHITVDFFNSISVNLRYDSIASTFGFDFYFDPQNDGHRKAFNPGHFHTVDIVQENEIILRGALLSPSFSSQANKQLSSFAGYSLAGVLEDCQIPTSLYPLQSDGKTLKEIIEAIIKPFGIGLVIDSSVANKADQVYDISTADEGASVKDYIASLASQKNIILSHTPLGNLLLTSAKTNLRSLFTFTKTTQSVLDMQLGFDGQKLHSSITAQKQASMEDDNAGEGVVKNPFVPYTFRPKVQTQNSGDDNDSALAARNLLSAELKGIKLSITLNTWYLNGKLIKPNNTIIVENDELFLYKPVKWFIESVTLTQNESSSTAVLNCVLPQVYDGKTPVNIFELH